MPRLNNNFNDSSTWKSILESMHRRIEVDLLEVEKVIELARRTPGLAVYEDELQQLSVFFAEATQFYQQNDPDGLTDLIEFWERYRSAVIQRYTAITPVELRAADKVVTDIFQRFISSIPDDKIAYSSDAAPLVYGGEGGLGGYYTNPPGWNRPFAIINLPHAAFDNVWQWLALPHETGHDTYATVEGLPEDIDNVLDNRMKSAVNNGEVNIPNVSVDLAPYGVDHQIEYSGGEFLSKLWRAWANEAQADIVGLLNCGGAAITSLQQIIQFGTSDQWIFYQTDEGFTDIPEPHPTGYIRNLLNIAALRLIGDGHDSLADELTSRLNALSNPGDNITWQLNNTPIIFASIPIAELARSAEIVAEVLVSDKFTSLGNQSYKDLGDFTSEDQQIVDSMAELLVSGKATFSQINGATARHSLAATIFAFEKDHSKAALINRTFKHFA